MSKIAGIPLERIISVLKSHDGNASAAARELGLHDKYLQRQMRHGKHAEVFTAEFPHRKKRPGNSGYKSFIHVTCRNPRCHNTVAINIVPGTKKEDYDLRRYCSPCKESKEEHYHTEFRDFTECWA